MHIVQMVAYCGCNRPFQVDWDYLCWRAVVDVLVVVVVCGCGGSRGGV